MRISIWPRRTAPLVRLGVAALILTALLPIRGFGAAAHAGRTGVIGSRTQASISYEGTVDPTQLATVRATAGTAGTTGKPRVVPFLVPHRQTSRQAALAAALAAAPRLTAATVSQADTTGAVPSHDPTGGVLLNSFNSLNAADQFNTHGYDLEPPDDAICAGPNGQVMQLVNNIGAVYNGTGAVQLGPFTTEAFFREPEALPLTSNSILSDPRCVYDPAAHAFYAEEWLATADDTGTVVNSRLDLAVNLTGDPTRTWYLFRIDTTDAAVGGCPCLPDYTQLGFDQNGIYLSSNDFASDALVNPFAAYVGDRVSAVSKSVLLSFLQHGGTGPAPTVFAYFLPNDFTVQPAVSYDPASRTDAQNEYFVESLDQEGSPNQLAVFAFTAETSLATTGPGSLVSTTLDSEAYGMPPAAVQKGYAGLITLDDDSVLQVLNAGGALWATLDSGVVFPNADPNDLYAAAAWFKLTPSPAGTHLAATIAAQGYVAAPYTFFGYPALMINSFRQAAMVLTTEVADPRYPTDASTYPLVQVASAADAGLNRPVANFSRVQTVATSTFPNLGFSAFLDGGLVRWGDYSAATLDPTTGTIVYLNTQWIPGPATEGSFANWGTYMVRFAPRPPFG